MSEPTIVSSVCSPWATAGDLPDAVTAQLTGLPPAEILAVLYFASDVLYGFSGRRWKGGGCTRTVTITADCGTSAEQVTVRRQTGRPAARPWGSRLQLPDSPVTAVTDLRDQAGTAIAGERWRLVNGRELEALDPATGQPIGWPWPEVTVSYEYGAFPPIGGKLATITLASELLLARVNAESCRLPERVQSITRQGISIAVLDPFDFLDRGRTGLVEIDTWLAAVNPGRARGRAMVWSPDTHRSRFRSHPSGG